MKLRLLEKELEEFENLTPRIITNSINSFGEYFTYSGSLLVALGAKGLYGFPEESFSYFLGEEIFPRGLGIFIVGYSLWTLGEYLEKSLDDTVNIVKKSRLEN